MKIPYSSQGSTKPGSISSQPGEMTPSNSSSLGFETEKNNGSYKGDNEISKPAIIINVNKNSQNSLSET